MNQILEIVICLAGILTIIVICAISSKYTSYWNRLEFLYLNKVHIRKNFGLKTLRIITPYDPWGIYNNFRYVVNVGADNQGIYFSMIFPISLIMRPIFIPWDEIMITKQNYLLVNRVELIPMKLPDIQFILSKELVSKIQNISTRCS